MMLMRMKLDKSQVQSLYEYKAAGAFNFVNRDLALMAGYTTYQALLVGASGGQSGQATGSGYWSGSIIRKNAPGGGGSLKLQESIKNLTVNEAITVGAAGGDGTSTSNNTVATAGATGGTSTFHGHSAYGGEGGQSNDFSTSSGFESAYSGGGGDGGGNSANLGTGGVGSSGGYHQNDPGGSPDFSSSSLPTTGTYVAGGTAPVVGGAKGGGGGAGDNEAASGDAGRAGATGANTDFAAAGGATTAGTGGDLGSHGGAGGGADLFPLTGVHEYYGNKITGKNSQGAVVIKLS